MQPLLRRNAAATLREMLGAFRLVVLGGARESGKSTLVEDLLGFPEEARFTLDDADVRRRATEDPDRLPRGPPSSVGDRRVPTRGRGPPARGEAGGRSRPDPGSAAAHRFGELPRRSRRRGDPAGRAGRLVLWPLSGGELRGVQERFVDRLFDPSVWPLRAAPWGRGELVEWLLRGGYPEVVVENLTSAQRGRWFDAYVADVVSREALRPIADVRREAELRRVLRLLAARTGQELVVADLAADAGLDRTTVRTYVALLDALYLVTLVPAWATSATTRARRRAKIVLNDPGLAAHLCNAGESTFGPRSDGRLAGALFETAVVTEVAKQATWSERTVDLLHYRDRNGPEVDLVVEDRRSGEVAGLEIKLTASPSARDARHLALLRDRLGSRFAVGAVVHTGRHVLPLGERLWAIPVTALWSA